MAPLTYDQLVDKMNRIKELGYRHNVMAMSPDMVNQIQQAILEGFHKNIMMPVEATYVPPDDRIFTFRGIGFYKRDWVPSGEVWAISSVEPIDMETLILEPHHDGS